MSAIDLAITQLAAGQHGVFATSQLPSLTVIRSVLRRRVADGRLHRVHRGVYSVGPVRTVRGRWMAACLALGPEAVLSHQSAAALHQLRATGRALIDVTVPRRADSRRGIAVHRTRLVHPADRTTVDGVPVTSIPRTLLDLAEASSPTQLRRAYEAAERERVLDVAAIKALLARSNGRRGVTALAALLDYDPALAAEAKSEFEAEFLDFVRESGLPLPQVNVLVEGFEVDAYWPQARLVVELQSFAFHAHRRAFDRDYSKLGGLTVMGYQVLPVTARQLREERGWLEGAIRSMFRRREPQTTF